MKQTGVDSSIYFTNLKHNIKLIFGFQMSHEIGFSGKICFYTNLICHAKFSFTQLIFQHKVFSAKFGSGFNFKQIFSAIFSLIFLRKNRSEAFCVSSEKYIAVNGKSIGEGRATLLTISKEDLPKAKCFFRFLNYGKKKYEKHFCGYC